MTRINKVHNMRKLLEAFEVDEGFEEHGYAGSGDDPQDACCQDFLNSDKDWDACSADHGVDPATAAEHCETFYGVNPYDEMEMQGYDVMPDVMAYHESAEGRTINEYDESDRADFWEVVDNPFNQENYADLVGKKFPNDKVPSYAHVKPIGEEFGPGVTAGYGSNAGISPHDAGGCPNCGHDRDFDGTTCKACDYYADAMVDEGRMSDDSNWNINRGDIFDYQGETWTVVSHSVDDFSGISARTGGGMVDHFSAKLVHDLLHREDDAMVDEGRMSDEHIGQQEISALPNQMTTEIMDAFGRDENVEIIAKNMGLSVDDIERIVDRHAMGENAVAGPFGQMQSMDWQGGENDGGPDYEEDIFIASLDDGESFKVTVPGGGSEMISSYNEAREAVEDWRAQNHSNATVWLLSHGTYSLADPEGSPYRDPKYYGVDENDNYEIDQNEPIANMAGFQDKIARQAATKERFRQKRANSIGGRMQQFGSDVMGKIDDAGSSVVRRRHRRKEAAYQKKYGNKNESLDENYEEIKDMADDGMKPSMIAASFPNMSASDVVNILDQSANAYTTGETRPTRAAHANAANAYALAASKENDGEALEEDNRVDGRFTMYVEYTGHKGEEAAGSLSYTVSIVDGRPVVDPNSLTGIVHRESNIAKVDDAYIKFILNDPKYKQGYVRAAQGDAAERYIMHLSNKDDESAGTKLKENDEQALLDLGWEEKHIGMFVNQSLPGYFIDDNSGYITLFDKYGDLIDTFDTYVDAHNYVIKLEANQTNENTMVEEDQPMNRTKNMRGLIDQMNQEIDETDYINDGKGPSNPGHSQKGGVPGDSRKDVPNNYMGDKDGVYEEDDLEEDDSADSEELTENNNHKPGCGCPFCKPKDNDSDDSDEGDSEEVDESHELSTMGPGPGDAGWSDGGGKPSASGHDGWGDGNGGFGDKDGVYEEDELDEENELDEEDEIDESSQTELDRLIQVARYQIDEARNIVMKESDCSCGSKCPCEGKCGPDCDCSPDCGE